MHPRSSFEQKQAEGETHLRSFLKKLPDDYLIWYEPDIDNRHPDFIVIAPDPGVIIMEVKGLHPDNIVQGNHSGIPVNINDRGRDLLPA